MSSIVEKTLELGIQPSNQHKLILTERCWLQLQLISRFLLPSETTDTNVQRVLLGTCICTQSCLPILGDKAGRAPCRTSVAQELQELVQLQQQELQRLQLQQQQQAPELEAHPAVAGSAGGYAAGAWRTAGASQLEAANAELRQQLQGTTSRLQDMEAAMSKLLDQQVRLFLSAAAITADSTADPI